MEKVLGRLAEDGIRWAPVLFQSDAVLVQSAEDLGKSAKDLGRQKKEGGMTTKCLLQLSASVGRWSQALAVNFIERFPMNRDVLPRRAIHALRSS